MKKGDVMRRSIVLSSLVLVSLALPVVADPVFYVAPNTASSLSSTLDQAWQAAVGPFYEADLDAYAHGYDLDSFTMGSITVDVGVGGLGGTASTAEIFKGSWGTSKGTPVYGTVYGKALVNHDATDAIHGDITFEFSQPIAGFGAWVYDNSSNTRESFQMIVTEVGGATFTSDTLESGNGTAHYVEGWLGATSTKGITDVAYRVIDTGTGDAVARAFEIDHLQLTPVPAAALLGLLGLGAAGWKLRKLM